MISSIRAKLWNIIRGDNSSLSVSAPHSHNDGTGPPTNPNAAGDTKNAVEDGLETVEATGIITVLDNDRQRGVIDRMYQFDIQKFPSVNSQPHFQRGSKMDFKAEKSQRNPQWEVTFLQFHEPPNVEQVHQERPTVMVDPNRLIVGCIKSIRGNYIAVEINNPKQKPNSTLKISLQGVRKHIDILWQPGDWVQFHLENAREDDKVDSKIDDYAAVSDFAPLNSKPIVGKVTKLDSFLLVDDLTNLTLIPKPLWGHPVYNEGTQVQCIAIQSSQRLVKNDWVSWRAIKVEKTTNFSSKTSSSANCPDSENEGERITDDFDIVTCHQALLQDKSGIKITPNRIRFPKLTTGASATTRIKIENTNVHVITLQEITCNRDPSVCNFDFKLEQAEHDENGSILIFPGGQVSLQMSCKAFLIGETTELCIFQFETFRIGRLVIVEAKPEEMQLEASAMDGDHAVRKPVDISKIILDRERPRIKGNQTVRPPFFFIKKLPMHEVPKELWIACKDKNDDYLRQLYPTALAPLSYTNYKEKFHVNLWLEEIENEKRRREYDQTEVVLTLLTKCNEGNRYVFTVPGIQEFLPPVNILDTIDVFEPENASNVKFEGTIKDVSENQVTCTFPPAFDTQYTGNPLTVQFRLSRTNYRRCHFAVDTAFDYLGESVLFPANNVVVKQPRMIVIEDESDNCEEELEHVPAPTPSIFHTIKSLTKTVVPSSSKASIETNGVRMQSCPSRFVSDTACKPSCTNPKLRWFNKKLNEEQRNAVHRILRGQARPLPYVIYGPPGTGKTVTLVEAIMQINKLDKNSRVLVCSSSNAAADLIAEYLVKSNQYQPGEFLRFNAFTRSGLSIPKSIEPFCTEGMDLTNIAMHRLIISTCTTAGQFSSLDLSVGHFTHVFIDEAGYCTEPETLIAGVLVALFKGGQLILAGDPNQLGPVLISQAVRKESCGLNMSFLERLMATPLYSRDVKGYPKENYNSLVVTRLVKNYRSHPTLLKLPSRLFYDDELVPATNFEQVDELCQNVNIKEALECKTLGVPLYFYGVQGDCVREKGSYSWYNMVEVFKVINFVSALINDCGLNGEDIGIITPYRKQVERIRYHLLQDNLKPENLPKIASVQEFQGGERKVIIISTVRSVSEDKVDKCVDQLSFIYQPKLFNVAITRAKAFMIVVGNPHVLAKSKHWFQLLNYSIELKNHGGCNLPKTLCPTLKDVLIKTREQIVTVAKVKNEEKQDDYEDYDDLEEPVGF